MRRLLLRVNTVRRLARAGVVLFGVFFSSMAVADVADYSIAAIEYTPGPMDKVGSVKAGLLCLPKGTLRWRDVARPGDDVLMRQLGSALVKGGLSVAARPDPLFADAAPLTQYRIKVVVERVKLRLCVAGLGIGEKQPSGEGNLTVRWETYDRVARTQVDSVAFDLPMTVDGRDARGQSGVIGDALVESAVRYAVRRKP